MNIHEYSKCFDSDERGTKYLCRFWNKKFKKFNGTSEKFEIPFLEHRILEPSRQHQLSQYAPQIEAYDVSFSFRLRICWFAYAIQKNGCFTKISEKNHVLNTFS